jgi:hypothetical protein
MYFFRFVRYFTSILHHNNLYFGTFVLCEFLNIFFLAVNFSATNAFLNYKWGTYGFQVYNYYTGDEKGFNPMCNIFPLKVRNIFSTFLRILFIIWP